MQDTLPCVACPDGGLGIEDAIALVGRIAREADVVGANVTEFAASDDMKPAKAAG